MNNFLKKNIIVRLLISLYLIFCTISCMDLSSGPDSDNRDSKIVGISNPSSNSILSEGINEIIYYLESPYSLRFLELYINGNFKGNYPPGQDGTAPRIFYDFDSSYVGKNISLYLIYYDSNGTSQKSNVINNILITIDNRPPFKPFDVSLLKFPDGSCNISWKDTSRYVEKYEIWSRTGVKGEYKLLLQVSGNSNNVNDYDLEPDSVYFYKVRGIKASGTSAFSSEVNTAGIFTSGDLMPPTDLKGEMAGQNAVQLTWKDNSNNENYFVPQRSNDGINFINLAALSRNTSAYKDSASGLINGNIYYYRVKAYSNTDSAYSNMIGLKIRSGILYPPANLTAVYNSTVGVIELKWIKSDNNTLYFDIERKTDQNEYQNLRRVDAGTTLYLDFNVEKNRTYKYRIRGYDLNVFSAYSNEAIVLTN